MPIVTGTVQDESETLFVGTVFFDNIDAPCSAGSRVTGPATTSAITGSDGSLPANFRLAPGRTKMICDGRERVFWIPEGSGTYDLSQLIKNTVRTRVTVDTDTIANLRLFQSTSSNFKAEVLTDANGAYAIFKWDATATNADDGASYVRPSDFVSAGLWVRIL